MSISFQCPGCEKKLKAKDESSGKRLKCPGCGQSLLVPGASSQSLPNSPAALPLNSPPQRRQDPTIPPVPLRRRVRWPWYVAGAAALSLLAVVVFFIASPGKVRTPTKAETAAVTPPELKPETRPEFKPEPKPETKPEPKPDSKEELKPKAKPKPGGQVTAPLLSNIAIQSAKTDPVLIRFSVELDVVRGTIPFEEKAGLWFCFGTPTTIPSLRATLEDMLKDADNRFFLNTRGPGFVAAQCSGIKQDADKQEVWTGTIDLGKANIQGGQIEIPSAFGSTYYKVTEVPISWVYYDSKRRLSNELKATVDLKTGKVVLIVAPSSSADEKSDTIWKLERTKDGRTVLSDGKLLVIFPADAKVEAKGSYASVSIKQKTEAMLEGYLSVERKDIPADAKKAADPRKWLKSYVGDEVEKDRKSVDKSEKGETKEYNDVKLVKTGEITLGEFKGLKSITDHERALSSIRIEGGLHSVAETDHYLIGDHLYFLRAGGSGAPKAPQLFGDHTGFHRSEMAQQFFKWAKVQK